MTRDGHGLERDPYAGCIKVDIEQNAPDKCREGYSKGDARDQEGDISSRHLSALDCAVRQRHSASPLPGICRRLHSDVREVQRVEVWADLKGVQVPD